MTQMQVTRDQTLALLPALAHPTITALEASGIHVTCWKEQNRWTLRGNFNGYMRQTTPTLLLTMDSAEELWRLMQLFRTERKVPTSQWRY